jgi:CheY-like chemotaxis protein
VKFILADDSTVPRDYARRILTRLGHQVVFSACNGREAVDYARANPDIDVALLDISMPEMTGTQAARIFLDEKLTRYVLIASSNSQKALVDAMREIGCGFIAKPYEPEQMRKYLARSIPELAT